MNSWCIIERPLPNGKIFIAWAERPISEHGKKNKPLAIKDGKEFSARAWKQIADYKNWLKQKYLPNSNNATPVGNPM